MATAWELLIENSSLPEIGNDAWEHLNAQQGGGSGGYLVLWDGLGLTIDATALELSLLADELALNVDQGTVINVTTVDDGMDLQVDGGLTLQQGSDSMSLEVGIPDCTIIIKGDAVLQKVAAENVGGHHIIIEDNLGHVLHAQREFIINGATAIGMTLQAAMATSDVFVAISGDEVTDASWDWDPIAPIYLGVDGAMTQTPELIDFTLIVAVALTATSIRIQIEMPIFL